MLYAFLLSFRPTHENMTYMVSLLPHDPRTPRFALPTHGARMWGVKDAFLRKYFHDLLIPLILTFSLRGRRNKLFHRPIPLLSPAPFASLFTPSPFQGEGRGEGE